MTNGSIGRATSPCVACGMGSALVPPLTSLNVGDAFTLEAWVKPADSGDMMIAAHGGGGHRRAVVPEQAEPDRCGVDQMPELFLALAQGVLDPAPGRHGLAQVGDLLAQAGDLVDEILFGTVLVAHVRD